MISTLDIYAQKTMFVHMKSRNVHFMNGKFGCNSKSCYFCNPKFHNNIIYL